MMLKKLDKIFYAANRPSLISGVPLRHVQNSSKKKQSKPDYLFGINPVIAALKANRREFDKIYLNIAEKES